MSNSGICSFFCLGKYAFIEASSPRRPGDKAVLKIYGSGENRCLSFAYHMWGAGIGSLAVYQQELGRGLQPALLWIKSRNQGQRWHMAELNIKGYHQYKVTKTPNVIGREHVTCYASYLHPDPEAEKLQVSLVMQYKRTLRLNSNPTSLLSIVTFFPLIAGHTSCKM